MVFKRCARVKESRFDGANRYGNYSGDFMDAQVLSIEQVDDRALFFAQPCDRRGEIGPLIS